MKRFSTVVLAVFVVVFLPLHSAFGGRFEVWRDNLKNPNILLKRSAIKKLGELGDRRATKHLLPLLSDEDSKIKVLVIKSLVRLRDISVIGALRKLSRLDNDASVRREAAKAAGILTLIKRRKEERSKKGALDE